MKNLLAELENNEAVLLMYLNGELSADDSAEVEGMLRNDAALREQLSGLRLLNEFSRDGIARADVPLTLSRRESAARAASSAIRQWQVERVSKRAPAAYVPLGWRGRIAYSSAAAAAILVLVFGAWSMYQTDDNSPLTPDPVEVASIAGSTLDGTTTEDPLLPTALTIPLINPDLSQSDGPRLDTMFAAERQLLALRRLQEVEQ